MTKASMTFGQWIVGGQIQFSDVTRTVGSGEDTTTVLAQRTARFQLSLSKEGGKNIRFAAIDAILKSTDEGGGLTLDKAKVEMLRTHLAELRKMLDKK